MIEQFFRLKENGTTVRTEVLAGVTTFMTMAYIIVVNPGILSSTGMDFGAVMTATILASAFGTILMALLANYPFALAPGMGLNAFFAFTVVLGMGISWQVALAAVFIDGIIFIILTLTKARESIVNSIPQSMKLATSAGIGLFITLIGALQAGFVFIDKNSMLPGVGDFSDPKVLLAAFGLIFTGWMVAKKVRGALLIGILVTTAVGWVTGLAQTPEGIVSAPPSLAPIFLQMDLGTIFGGGFMTLLTIIFTFTFVDLFDTVGTLVGVATKANLLDEKGQLPRARQALFADAAATTVGAVLGTSTVTTYIESASGVSEGGRTGLASVVTGLLFLLALFFAPVVQVIPGQATAPILILVGLAMIEPIGKIDFSDFTEALPAFLTIVIMPFSYSIAEGLVFGILSYVFLKFFTGRTKEISVTMWILAVLFIIRFIVG